ncbi:MAG TPA: hypothetical protein VE571_15280, partial [Solirubrobacteraceae bacterium]|nr:hypothetical protein [Solirubrobacteraceae bacterium]
MAEFRERTAAEREAARLERERRRQQRLVEPASPASDGDGVARASAGGVGRASDGDGVDPEREWDDAAVRTESRMEPEDLDGYDSVAQDAELTGDSGMDEDYDFTDSTEEH